MLKLDDRLLENRCYNIDNIAVADVVEIAKHNDCSTAEQRFISAVDSY